VKTLRHALVGISRATTVLGLCALVLSGCGKKSADQATASGGQVVAHIGNEDVTVQELQNEFRLANVPPDRQKDPALVKQAVGELVLRKYLSQQAVAAKLDREPNVLLDLLRARTQVLANAYLARAVAAKPISQPDIDKYIASNPLKFANRQLVSVEQIVFAIGPTAQAAVEASKDLKSLDEVDQKLTSLGIAHNRAMGALNTAEIPENLFNLIQAKKADDVFFVQSGANGIFFKVTGEAPRPLEGESASNMARQMLRADELKAEIGIASVAANLEAKYQGDYAKIMSNEETPSAKK
jgi:EpsD family peptidyl-prolyl cis-trans isomerase